MQQAVNAPRFHHQWMPDELKMEKIGFSPDTIHMLEHMGHNGTELYGSNGYLGRCRVHRD